MNNRLIKTVKIVTVCATCLLVLLVGVIIGQYASLNNLNNQKNKLDAELSSMQTYEEELQSGISARKTDSYLELQARQELGMIKEGETVYIYR
ncbi:MAG: septum formation initiator family protein [Clostridia bacterium]|nr:septum formation initiator family protein [Clostridia bacterium]